MKIIIIMNNENEWKCWKRNNMYNVKIIMAIIIIIIIIVWRNNV